jgi:hypothetical protein
MSGNATNGGAGNGGGGGGCRQGIRELVVWAGGPALTADERRRVETHAADCPECAELLSFAEEMGRAARAAREATAPGTHPAPEALVAWVEAPESVAATERTEIESHVAACDACTEEARILARVEAEPAAAGAKGAEPRAERPRPRPESPVVRWLERLRGSLLAPVPAAAYLAIAVLAVGLLVRGPDVPAPDGRITEPILLGDSRSTVRGDVEALPPPVFDRERPRPLLLELTGLAATPAAEAEYDVRIATAGPEPRTLWQESIRGAEFRETFSLVVRPDPRALRPGPAEIRVVGPDGEAVFEARLEVR